MIDYNSIAGSIYGWKKNQIVNQSFLTWSNAKCIPLPVSFSDRDYLLSGTTIQNRKTNINSEIVLWSIAVCFSEDNTPCGIVLFGRRINNYFDVSKELSDFSKNITGNDIGPTKLPKDYLVNIVRYFEGIISNLPCYVFWKNKHFVYLGCNELAATELLNFRSSKEIVGKTDYDFGWDKKLVDEFRKLDQEIIATGVPKLSIEDNVTVKGKGLVNLLVNKMPLFNEHNEVIGIIGISVDITDRKKMEAELRQAKIAAEAAAGIAKTIFISYMSHDIKNPLRGVIASSYALQKHLSDEQDKSDCQLIYENASVLMKFLDGILDAATAGDIRDDKRYDETFNLRESIEDLAVLQKLYAKSKDLDLQIEIDEKIPLYVVSDKEKIERVVLNLIGNAINYTEKGYIKVNIKLSSKKGDALNIKFSVEDTGVGIAKDKLDKVFTKGYRVEADKNKVKGQGLGLSIAKNFIALLGGKLSLKSKLGKGTTVSFVLPVKIGNAANIPAEKRAALHRDNAATKIDESMQIHKKGQTKTIDTSALKYPNGLTALVVDDEPGCLRSSEIICDEMGINVIGKATNGMDALSLVKKHAFDLIVTDIGLGDGLSGDEFIVLTRKFEEMSNRSQRAAIVAITGHAAEETLSKYLMNNGAHDVIDKSMDILRTKNHILDALKETLGDKVVAEKVMHKKFFMAPEVAPVMLFELPEKEEDYFKLDRYPLYDLERADAQKTAQIEDEQEKRDYLLPFLKLMISGTIPKASQELAMHYQNKDWQGMTNVGHRLKGSVAYIATRLAYASFYMQEYYRAVENPSEKHIEKIYKQLIAVTEETTKAIANLVADYEKNKQQ